MITLRSLIFRKGMGRISRNFCLLVSILLFVTPVFADVPKPDWKSLQPAWGIQPVAYADGIGLGGSAGLSVPFSRFTTWDLALDGKLWTHVSQTIQSQEWGVYTGVTAQARHGLGTLPKKHEFLKLVGRFFPVGNQAAKYGFSAQATLGAGYLRYWSFHGLLLDLVSCVLELDAGAYLDVKGMRLSLHLGWELEPTSAGFRSQIVIPFSVHYLPGK